MKRIIYFDLLKFFGVFLICFGHSILALSDGEADKNIILQVMVAFHMPLFMIIAGFFSLSSLELSFENFIKKKALQLLLPVISSYLLYVMVIFFFKKSIIFNILQCGYFLWFLTSIFCCFVISWIVHKFFKNIYVGIIVSIICVWGCRYFNYCYISFMLPYFCCGIMLRKKIDMLEKIKKYLVFPLMILSICLLWHWDFSKSLYAVPIQFISFHNFDLNNLLMALYSFLAGLVVSMFFIVLCLVFNMFMERKAFFKKLSKIGQKTLGIYLLQKFTLELLFDELQVKLPAEYVTIVAFILGMIECYLCYKLVQIMEKSNLLSVLFLGHNKLL